MSASVKRCWVLEHGIWREDPGKGKLLAANRQPEGMGVRNSTTGKVCERSPCCHRRRALLLSGAQGVRLPWHPLPHALVPASTGTRRGACLSKLMCPFCQSLLQRHEPWWACVPCPSPPPPLPPGWACLERCHRKNRHRGGAQTTAEP